MKDVTTFSGVEEDNFAKLEEITSFIAKKYSAGELEDFKGSNPLNMLVLAPYDLDNQTSYHRALIG